MVQVSVIIPVYNVENYIGRCIESVINQTFSDIEIILIDDCSTDNSYSIIKEYAEKDDRIIALHHDGNHGPMVARRLGDKVARGHYITYCDGDDVLPNTSLENLYEAALSSNADIVSGNYAYVKVNGETLIKGNTLNYGQNSEALLKSLLRCEMSHILCSKLFKSCLLKDYDYEVLDHMKNAEDGYIFYQIAINAKKIIQLPNVVYYYMQNTNSSSQRRLNDDSIYNICLFNVKRISVVSRFPSLNVDLHKCITGNLFRLYGLGYNKDTNISSYIKENNLQEYVSLSKLYKYHNLKDIIKLLLKKYVQGVFVKLR